MRPRVWAPRAGVVRLRIGTDDDATTVELTETPGGWWVGDVDLAAGSRYGFLLDDDPTPLPDPRSRRQPDGVHGLSAVVDTADFSWTDRRWTGRQLAGSVVYELHVGTFTPGGTLDAAVERLDHLVDLGVDLVELLPVNAFNGEWNWGYDGVLWFAVDETYGGPTAYRRFVDACHSCGLGVIQDVVHNHLGPSGNYLPRFGPYLHDAATNTWGASVNLDEPEVRRFLVDNARMWFVEYHVDGLRLDAVHALRDSSPKHVLAELAEETDALSAALRRPLSLIAESDLNDPTLITSREAGGYGLTAQWSDDFHHAVHVNLTGETSGYYADFEHLDALAKVLTGGFFHDGSFSSFRGRPHGRPIDTATVPAWRLVVADQTHDQIGNRAAGDRLAATLDDGRLAIAAVLTLAGPFTPMLFMGEEWAASTPWRFFTAHPEPELARAVVDGRREEFARMAWDTDAVPDPQDPETFRRSKLDWSERDVGRHAAMLDLYRRLIRLRRERPELIDPRLDRAACDFDEAAGWFLVRRNAITTAVNLSPGAMTLPVGGVVLLATTDGVTATGATITLPPLSAAIADTGAQR